MAPRGTLKGGASSPGDVRSIVHVPMSAYGYERTFSNTLNYVRFTPESGPFSALAFMSANDPKRTFDRHGILTIETYSAVSKVLI